MTEIQVANHFDRALKACWNKLTTHALSLHQCITNISEPTTLILTDTNSRPNLLCPLTLVEQIYRDPILLRATSHTRLRARDHYTSSALIGGKGGAGPSSLHSTLEGPTKYVNAR